MKKRNPVLLIILLIVLAGLCALLFSKRASYNRAKAKVDAEAQLPDLPVEAGKRKALTGSGLVAQFENRSGKALPIQITFTNATFRRAKTFNHICEPKKVFEIGHLEGWNVATGDEVTIVSAGYKPLRLRF